MWWLWLLLLWLLWWLWRVLLWFSLCLLWWVVTLMFSKTHHRLFFHYLIKVQAEIFAFFSSDFKQDFLKKIFIWKICLRKRITVTEFLKWMKFRHDWIHVHSRTVFYSLPSFGEMRLMMTGCQMILYNNGHTSFCSWKKNYLMIFVWYRHLEKDLIEI